MAAKATRVASTAVVNAADLGSHAKDLLDETLQRVGVAFVGLSRELQPSGSLCSQQLRRKQTRFFARKPGTPPSPPNCG